MEIGPALPPHLAKKKKEESINSSETENNAEIGPSLPPSLTHEKGEQNDDQSSDNGTYGPALPPHLIAKTNTSRGLIGPARPEETERSHNESQRDRNESSDDDIGPVIGPLPSASSSSDQYHTSIEQDIEARSNAMKDKLLGKNKVKQKREEWMLELPPEIGKNFGLGPRTFRKQAVDCGDRSVWTDTPSDKMRKQEKESRKRAADDVKAPWEEEKEKNMKELIESYTKKHRGESLMDMHQQKLNKKKKEQGIKPNERRPFDRDRDLGHSAIDPEKRQALLKKSKELDSRFQKSSSTFL